MLKHRKKENFIVAFLRLTRIEHSVMLAIAVIAAEIIALGKVPAYPLLMLSIVPPILISMGAFAINDYFDIAIDRANSKNRPLVTGSIKPHSALAITAMAFLIGVALAAFINIAAFLIALIFALLAYAYSYRLKRIPLLGNIYIAFTMVIPFIYGSYVVTYAFPAAISLICLVVFLSGLAREMHGMVRDYEGDIKAGKLKNLVFFIGKARSSQLAFILYIEAIVISIFMLFFSAPFRFNAVYALPIALTDIMLAYVAVGFLLGKESKSFFRLSRNLSLGAMALATLAYLLSGLFFLPL
ncbi:MAG: UbiA family prenyltransferase [Candidatus Marsarchaeota archaeon]|jgi:geranylgeranylglycerol-phosphate geranylgeranyltransferase|nr:UbiA family prenyltransferase [Candidatus Marsarchaeota archaeon]